MVVSTTAGNMTFDGSTGVGVEYNVLGLPERIFAGTEDICYIYLADGTKLAQRVGSSLTYYCSVMVYTGTVNSLFTTPQYIIQPEGIIACEGANHVYKYFKTDHLGSTRMVLAAVQTGNQWSMQEVQSTDYYPFGLAWDLDNLNQNKYLFSGKELQDANIAGNLLGLYDFGARYYDPKLGRWFNPDPANQFANPYMYCANSPAMYVDPDGQFIHLILGAIIGGVVNLIANADNIHNFWQGLAYFGIGAASGAVGAGVGAGVSSVIAGSSFGAGFLGSSGAATAATSFWSGAAIGAPAGASSGFTAGFGNALMGGQDFVDAFGAGIMSGLIGGASGAVIGGLVGGIDAVSNDRTFWKGALPKSENNEIWGTMTLHTRVSANGEESSITDGHSWVQMVEDGSAKGETWGTWRSPDYTGSQLHHNNSSEYFNNLRNANNTKSITQPITYAQKARFDNYINKIAGQNNKWLMLKNCSSFSTNAFNYTTGLNISPHPFMVPVPTPSWLFRILK
ncbi:hypothetical protein FACS1894159_10950 [Bacteroidia bacterium]|nr:hypothetical protein FACS1894159_10950 [Bacteroidia bacterium]